MNFNFIIAQVFGVLVFIAGILSYYKNSTKEVLLFNGISNTLCALQYLFLGAYTGALCCIIATTRNVVFSRFKKDIPVSLLAAFIVILILTNCMFVKSVIDIIPIINVFIYSIALWTKDIIHIKRTSLIACIDGVVFNAYKRAYIGVIYEVVFAYAVIISYMALIKEKKKLK